jgi:hypothetical protein
MVKGSSQIISLKDGSNSSGLTNLSSAVKEEEDEAVMVGGEDDRVTGDVGRKAWSTSFPGYTGDPTVIIGCVFLFFCFLLGFFFLLSTGKSVPE